MQKKSLLLTVVLCSVMLSGCRGTDSVSDYQGVEAQQTTGERKENISESEKESASENEKETKTDVLRTERYRPSHFVSDSHFYESGPQTFRDAIDASYDNPGTLMMLEIVDAFTSKDLAAGGEYFENSEQAKTIMPPSELPDMPDGPCSYLFVTVKVTNWGAKPKNYCMSNFEIYVRLQDERGLEEGYGDKAIYHISDEMAYDCPDTGDGDKAYYFKLIQPRETITTTIMYYVNDEYLNEALYMQCGNEWYYDRYTGEPSEDENVKFLRVPLEQQ